MCSCFRPCFIWEFLWSPGWPTQRFQREKGKAERNRIKITKNTCWGDTKENMNLTGVAANEKVLPPGNSFEWGRRRGLFLRWALKMWLSYRDCPGPVLIHCTVDIPQAQVERISVCSLDLWAHYHPAPTSPNKTKPCHKSSWLTFTQCFLLNNGKGCTFSDPFTERRECGPTQEGHLTQHGRLRPGIRVSPLPWVTLLSGPGHPTLFQPVYSSVVDSSLTPGLV